MILAIASPVALTQTAGDQRAPQNSAAKPSFAKFVQARVNAAVDTVESDTDLTTASQILDTLMDQAVLYTPDDSPDALREADIARRLIGQLKHVPPEKRAALLRFLRANPNVAGTLAFLIPSDAQVAGAYDVLDRLLANDSAVLEKYANLASAICVVHYRPLARRYNGNLAKAADPVDIFHYYVQNEDAMFFGIREVPAELLAHVVDTTESIDEMNWALKNYAGTKDVGSLFFKIKYDYDNFLHGTPKQITLQGFNIENILKYGGVCVDQAYFATSVGKAIGVPTALDTGSSAEVGHAWVGFLQTDGSTGWWNFDSGRYAAYKGIRGDVTDPLTRRAIPDSYVSLLAQLIGTRPIDRQNAYALADAAQRLIAMEKDGTPAIAPPEEVANFSRRRTARKADTATELSLLELALRQSSGCSPAWFGVRDLAVAGKLSLDDKRRWADVLLRLGAKKYPDFTLAILSPMITSIPDPQEQDPLWNNLFALFESRSDLCASIRTNQAAMWAANGEQDKAGQCYMDIIERYANAGPFIIAALQGAEKILQTTNRADKVVTLYEQAWKRIDPPREMAANFMKQSNWYRVGKLYVQKLRESGDTATAESIDAELEKPMSASASSGSPH